MNKKNRLDSATDELVKSAWTLAEKLRERMPPTTSDEYDEANNLIKTIDSIWSDLPMGTRVEIKNYVETGELPVSKEQIDLSDVVER